MNNIAVLALHVANKYTHESQYIGSGVFITIFIAFFVTQILVIVLLYCSLYIAKELGTYFMVNNCTVHDESNKISTNKVKVDHTC